MSLRLVGRWLGKAALLFVLGSVCANPAQAQDEQPGFTLEVGVTGLAMTDASRSFYGATANGGLYPYSIGDVFVGVALPSIGVGYFVHPLLSLELRLGNFAYYPDAETVLNGFYGGVAQLWPLRWLYVGAGLGLATPGPTPVLSAEPNDGGAAFGTVLRGGVMLPIAGHHHIGISGDLFPTFAESGTTVAGVIAGFWRWL